MLAFLTGISFAYAQSSEFDNERTAEAHRRWMESAHPTPGGFVEPPLLPLHSPKIPRVLSTEANVSAFENVNLVEPETDQLPVQNESSIAINPKNPMNIIASAVDYRNGSSTWVYVSADGAKTWKNINLGKPFVGWTSSNDPSVAFAADGTGYLMYGTFGNRAAANPENGVMIARTTDEGKTWKLHGALQAPEWALECMITELKDGRLWLLTRTGGGFLWESHSSDKGRTWTEAKASPIANPGSRFFIRRLASGNLLLVNHLGFTGKTRSHLTAQLSTDDGQTWNEGLLLDERKGVSYPDGVQDRDGLIWITYDRDRGGDGEIDGHLLELLGAVGVVHQRTAVRLARAVMASRR